MKLKSDSQAHVRAKGRGGETIFMLIQTASCEKYNLSIDICYKSKYTHIM